MILVGTHRICAGDAAAENSDSNTHLVVAKTSYPYHNTRIAHLSPATQVKAILLFVKP